MPEVLTNLYQVSGNADHLATAKRFDHAQILDPLAANSDQLSGFHANTQIPKIIGAIREYTPPGRPVTATSPATSGTSSLGTTRT